ncbi:MAG: cysteine hydrolase family protein [Proteocatella sp.]
MNNVVLLIVDVQEALISEHPYNERNVIENIKELISMSRTKGIEVVYVRHDDGVGSTLELNTDGWQIVNEIRPSDDERIFEKQYNSAFYKTQLKAYLDSKQIENIILVGLQTEYCIDATCKSAFENGYNVIIPEGANTTFDNEYLSGERLYKFYNDKIWNNRFAEVVAIKDLAKIL